MKKLTSQSESEVDGRCQRITATIQGRANHLEIMNMLYSAGQQAGLDAKAWAVIALFAADGQKSLSNLKEEFHIGGRRPVKDAEK